MTMKVAQGVQCSEQLAHVGCLGAGAVECRPCYRKCRGQIRVVGMAAILRRMCCTR
jgi:hypothetical protein